MKTSRGWIIQSPKRGGGGALAENKNPVRIEIRTWLFPNIDFIWISMTFQARRHPAPETLIPCLIPWVRAWNFLAGDPLPLSLEIFFPGRFCDQSNLFSDILIPHSRKRTNYLLRMVQSNSLIPSIMFERKDALLLCFSSMSKDYNAKEPLTFSLLSPKVGSEKKRNSPCFLPLKK